MNDPKFLRVVTVGADLDDGFGGNLENGVVLAGTREASSHCCDLIGSDVVVLSVAEYLLIRRTLATMLASAAPNPRDHPVMSAAWAMAQPVLDKMNKL